MPGGLDDDAAVGNPISFAALGECFPPVSEKTQTKNQGAEERRRLDESFAGMSHGYLLIGQAAGLYSTGQVVLAHQLCV